MKQDIEDLLLDIAIVAVVVGAIVFEIWKWKTYYAPLGIPWWAHS